MLLSTNLFLFHVCVCVCVVGCVCVCVCVVSVADSHDLQVSLFTGHRSIFFYDVESKRKLDKWTYLQNRNRFTNLENEFIVAKKEEWGEGIVGESGIDMYVVLWVTNKDLVYGTGNSDKCYVAA